MIYIGIDPGQTGAMAAISPEGAIVFDFDNSEALAFLRLNRAEVRLSAVEKVSAMPKQGVSSTFKFGTNYGIWQGRLEACGIPYILVTPQKWQKAVFDSGTRGKDRKAMSIAMARRLFPDLSQDLRRKKDHGRADALLIAEYCRRLP